MRPVPSPVVQSSCSLGHQSLDKESFSDAQTADPHPPHLNWMVKESVILTQDSQRRSIVGVASPGIGGDARIGEISDVPEWEFGRILQALLG